MGLSVPYNTQTGQPFLLPEAAPAFGHSVNTLVGLVPFLGRWVLGQEVLQEFGGRGRPCGVFEEKWGLILHIRVGTGDSRLVLWLRARIGE